MHNLCMGNRLGVQQVTYSARPCLSHATAAADLVVLSANPLEDISVLADPSKFVAVIKGGIVVCRRPDMDIPW